MQKIKNSIKSQIKYYSNIIFRVILKWIFIKNNPLVQYKIKKAAKNFYKKPVKESLIQTHWNDFVLFTIAFNSSILIEKQILDLKNYVTDKFYHIIVDNWDNTQLSEKLKKICKKNDVGYIKLPKNELQYSDSHWAALTYTYKNFIQNNKEIAYFWFLDHDIFPIKKISILEKLKQQDIYGVLIDKKSDWFGWVRWKRRFLRAWFCIYKNIYDDMDFMPNKRYFPLSILDTWGSNRDVVYKNIDPKSISLESYQIIIKHIQGNIYRYRTFGDRIHFRWGDWDKGKMQYLEAIYHKDEH